MKKIIKNKYVIITFVVILIGILVGYFLINKKSPNTNEMLTTSASTVEILNKQSTSTIKVTESTSENATTTGKKTEKATTTTTKKVATTTSTTVQTTTTAKTVNPYTYVSYNDYESMLNSNKKAVFVVTRDSCYYCKMYKPVMQEIKDNYHITIYGLNPENTSVSALNIAGTPTTIFINNGEEVKRISGAYDYDYVSSVMNSLGY